MTTHNETHSYTVPAAADLSAAKFRAITVAGTILTGPMNGPGGGAIGVLTNAPRSGDLATYVYAGIQKVLAGAAVATLGYPISVGSSGFFFATASGGNFVGRALETATSGDLFQAMVDFTQFPAWNGV